MEELPNREGKLAMRDVKTVEVLALFTSAFSKKTTHTQLVPRMTEKELSLEGRKSK